MPGRGPAPKENRQNPRDTPKRGEIEHAASSGWQHGPVPAAPAKLTKAAREAWDTWMGAWFASFWTPDDLPGLRQVIRLYDQVERGEFQRAAEVRLQMDTYGITPKGQQDRRWARPKGPAQPPAGEKKPTRYDHLRTV